MVSLPESDAWEKCQNPKNPENWALLTFKEGSKKEMEVTSGTGGREEFIAQLKEDQVQYGAFVVYGVDQRANVVR